MSRSVCRLASKSLEQRSAALRQPAALLGSRSFSVSAARHATSLNVVTEEEEALREAVQRFANETLTPDKVREMDEAENMDMGVVKALFDAGVRSRNSRGSQDTRI